ncbi:MAG: hypothetical protein LBL87_00450 [Ruminococcus sp.]|nr:hypothetical protein [Ruminococcus sp.]
MKKSVSELSAMLADDTLFPLDETANADIIERICDVIAEKEKVSARTVKAESQKAWRQFKKKYITPDTAKPLTQTEIVEAKNPKKQTFTPVLTALAAAAIIVLVVKLPSAIPQVPAADTAPADIIETTALETTAAEPEKVIYYNETSHMLSGGVRFIAPDDYEVVESDVKVYDDDSIKSYTIYSSGDKIFFISVSPIVSNDVNSPTQNLLDPFDIYEGTYLENADDKKDETLLKSWIVMGKQVIIYDEEPGATAFSYNQGVFTYAHDT